jgi:hypothetical protein
MAIEMQMTGSGASFPQFEDGLRLNELTHCVAKALGTEALRPEGSPLECLVRFDAYPNEFALWWDGFTCELGCSAPCGVEMVEIAGRLIASGAFAFA